MTTGREQPGGAPGGPEPTAWSGIYADVGRLRKPKQLFARIGPKTGGAPMKRGLEAVRGEMRLHWWDDIVRLLVGLVVLESEQQASPNDLGAYVALQCNRCELPSYSEWDPGHDAAYLHCFVDDYLFLAFQDQLTRDDCPSKNEAVRRILRRGLELYQTYDSRIERFFRGFESVIEGSRERPLPRWR
jgi:hypothetical protein